MLLSKALQDISVGWEVCRVGDDLLSTRARFNSRATELIEIYRCRIARQNLTRGCSKRASPDQISALARFVNPIRPAVNDLRAPLLNEEFIDYFYRALR